MIVKSLSLENIRSYKKQVINFNEEISLLSGDIGSGKSSVLQAIEFALLGFKRGDLEGIQLLRKGCKEGSVKLILQDTKMNSQVEIYRRIKKAKNSEAISQENGYLKLGEELVEMSPQELNSHVFEILHFPKEFINKDKNLLYRFTIYTAQEQLKEILFAEPEKRLELLRKIFQIDKYKQVKQAISLYLTVMKSKKKELQIKLENEFSVNNEIKDLKMQVQKILIEVKKFKLEEIQIKEKLITCNDNFKKIDLIKEKYSQMILKLEKVLSTLESYLEQKKFLIEELNILKIENEELFGIDIKKKQIDLSVTKKERELVMEKIVSNLNLCKEELKIINSNKKIQEQLREEIKNYEIKKDLILQMKKSFDYILTKCKLKESQVEIKKFELKLKNLEEKKSILENNIEKTTELEIKIEFLNADVLEIENRLKNFKNLDKCPHCFTPITRENEKIIFIHINQEKEKLITDRNKKNLTLDEFKKIQEKLKNELKEYDFLFNKKIEFVQKEKLLLEQEQKESPMYENQKKLQEELEMTNKKELTMNEEELKKKIKNEEKINKRMEKLLEEEKKIQKQIQQLELDQEKLINVGKNLELIKKEMESKKIKINLFEKELTKKKPYEEKLKLLKEKNEILISKKNRYIELKENLSLKEKECLNLLTSNSTKLEERENQIKKYEDQLKEFENLKLKYKKFVELEEFLGKKAYSLVDVLERKLFTRFYIEFNEAFEYYFKQLIEDNEIEVRLDEEFTPLVEQNGYDVSINTLSGGEKSSLAIAYRLGLKKIIEENLKTDSGLNMLILDEPTDGFSIEQIDRLGVLLKESHVEQTLLVSHDEKLESIANHLLKVEKNNHISVISNF